MRAAFGAIFVLLLIGMFTLLLSTYSVKANPKTIIVPDNYPSVSAAIGNASQGDTIFVRTGIYYENPWIDKSLSLVGEDSENTIVIGSGGIEGGNVFTLSADGVEISGFTIKSLDYSTSSYYANGVSVAGDNCVITGNNIENNYWGIYCGGGGKSSTTISQNNITANHNDGIRFYGGFSNTVSGNNFLANNGSGITIDGYSNMISGNNIQNNQRGIELGASYSVVFGNNITGSSINAIYIQTSNNIISANSVADNHLGVYLSPYFAPNNNTFYHNNFFDNDQNAYTGSAYNVQCWDNGYPSGGNYWDNYTGIDAKSGTNQNVAGTDGIGDTPLTLDANNTDRYPLMAPFNVYNAGPPPSANQPPLATSDHTAALWHFDEVEPNNVSPDATGSNPAVLGPYTNMSFAPLLVTGKFGNALSFPDLHEYVYVTASPSLDMPGEITIDAWIYIRGYREDVSHNNIVTKAVRTIEHEPTRLVGLALNGEKNSSVPQGALRGFVTTETEGFNEIVTTEPIPMNQWIHVVFVRSLTTGMHLYVDGIEKSVAVTSGVQNPAGSIKRGTELYMGHDYNGMTDEVRISDVALLPQSPALWMQWWFWAAIATAIVVVAIAVYFLKKRQKSSM